MPRTIKADGRTITVPDDATPDEINQIVGPGPDPNAQFKAPGAFIKPGYENMVANTPITSGPNQRGAINAMTSGGILPGNGPVPENQGLVQSWLNRNAGVDAPTGLPDGPSDQMMKFGQGLVRGGVNIVQHPLDTLSGMLSGALRSSPPGMAYDALRGRPTAPAELGTALRQHSADTLGQMTAPVLLGQGAQMLGNIPESFNPPPNYVSPVEQAIRKTTKSLNLPVNSVEPMVQDLMGPNGDGSVAGIIQNYAQRAGKPIVTPLDAAKVAQQAGDDVLAHYRQITQPFQKDQVQVGSANSPIASGEGKMASIGDVEARITKINQLEQKAREAADNGNQSPMANMEQLENERSGLQSILYKELSKRTGVPESQIGQLRQTYGKLYSTSDGLTRAANGVRDAAGLPAKSIPEAVSRLVNSLRGGQEAVFNSRFRQTLPDLPSNEPVLPQAGPVPVAASPRAPLWQDLQASKTPIQPVVPDMEGAQALRASQAATRAAQQQALEDQANLQKLQAQAEVLRMHQGTTTAQDLAANRAAQAALIRRANATAEANAYRNFVQNGAQSPQLQFPGLPADHPLNQTPLRP